MISKLMKYLCRTQYQIILNNIKINIIYDIKIDETPFQDLILDHIKIVILKLIPKYDIKLLNSFAGPKINHIKMLRLKFISK